MAPRRWRAAASADIRAASAEVDSGRGVIVLTDLFGGTPSNLAIAGRYVFRPEIFRYIDETTPGKNDEIQLTDAMVRMLADRGMYGLRFAGKRYDIGNKLDFIKTKIGVKHRTGDQRSGSTVGVHCTGSAATRQETTTFP